jgi:hypothetical protein
MTKLKAHNKYSIYNIRFKTIIFKILLLIVANFTTHDCLSQTNKELIEEYEKISSDSLKWLKAIDIFNKVVPHDLVNVLTP